MGAVILIPCLPCNYQHSLYLAIFKTLNIQGFFKRTRILLKIQLIFFLTAVFTNYFQLVFGFNRIMKSVVKQALMHVIFLNCRFCKNVKLKKVHLWAAAPKYGRGYSFKQGSQSVTTPPGASKNIVFPRSAVMTNNF